MDKLKYSKNKLLRYLHRLFSGKGSGIFTLVGFLMSLLNASAVFGQESLGHKVIPIKNLRDQYLIQSKSEYDINRYPMYKYEIDDDLISPIIIGEKIPQSLLDLPLRIVGKGVLDDTTTLRKISNTKLVILDFWSTWCSPCVKSMNKWEKIASDFGDDIRLLGVHIDYDYKAHPFIEKNGWNSHSVIGLNAYVLNRHFFDRNAVSRVVWIKEGQLIAITGTEDIEIDVIKKVIEGYPVNIPQVLEWSYKKEELR